MVHIWQLKRMDEYKKALFHKELYSLIYGMKDFAKIYKKEGCSKELKHDIILTTFEDLDCSVLAYMCNPGMDYYITAFLKKVKIVLFQRWIIKNVIADCKKILEENEAM